MPAATTCAYAPGPMRRATSVQPRDANSAATLPPSSPVLRKKAQRSGGSTTRSHFALPECSAGGASTSGRAELGEVQHLQHGLREDERRQDEEHLVLRADERVVVGLGGGVVEREPDAGEHEVAELQDQDRVPERAGLQGARRAHRSGEERRERVRGNGREVPTVAAKAPLHHQLGGALEHDGGGSRSARVRNRTEASERAAGGPTARSGLSESAPVAARHMRCRVVARPRRERTG